MIDATRTGNDARYMAHSQDANCQCQKWVVDNQPRAFMVALRDIAPGEELTYNYYRQCSLGEQVRSAYLLWDFTLRDGHMRQHQLTLSSSHTEDHWSEQQVMFLWTHLL